jgi:hypothetical protein
MESPTAFPTWRRAYDAAMLSKDFLLTQHADWARHLSRLNAELHDAGGSRDRHAALERVVKATEWLNHYALLLRDELGVQT